MKIIRLLDLDDRNDQEVSALQAAGIRTLSVRDLENYLLADDVIAALCESETEADAETVTAEAIAERDRLLEQLPETLATDDFKAIAGDFFNWCKARFSWHQRAKDRNVFLRDVMAPLLAPGMDTYAALRSDIFG